MASKVTAQGDYYTDNGPECSRCQGTGYRYTVDTDPDEGTQWITIRCSGCTQTTERTARGLEDDVKTVRGWHEITATVRGLVAA